MSDRFKGLLITFERDIRDDDMEAITTAARMIKGVTNVVAIPENRDDHMNRERVKHEIQRKLLETLDRVFD